MAGAATVTKAKVEMDERDREKIDRYLDRGGEKQIKKPRDTYGDM